MTPPHKCGRLLLDCHRSVLRNDTHPGGTLDPTAPYEPIRSRNEYTAFRCRLKRGSPLRVKFMATRNILDQRNKAVVAFLDGRRLKGYICNFLEQNDRFRLFFEQETAEREGTEVPMKDLKAIFFARDFVGGREYTQPQEPNSQNQSRKAEVTFRDGERLVGTTDDYHPQKIGFFLVPVDPRSNNLRVFVIAKNAKQIRWL